MIQQFDVLLSPDDSAQYVLVLQTDLLLRVDTVVVAPLMSQATGGPHMTKLNPTLDVLGEPFVLITQELAGVHRTRLGTRVGSLAEKQDAVIAALDMLYTGIYCISPSATPSSSA